MSEAAPHREHDAADEPSLARAVPLLAGGPLAVDVETNAMHVYRARLCFVQLATATDIVIVDTLAVKPQPLQPVFADPSVRKILHDAQGDLRSLQREGITVSGVFDTQRAATFLGLPKVGLGDLVDTHFGVKLKKEHQTADFGERPVPPAIRAYIADDVRFLIPLAEVLERIAREQDVLEELQLDFLHLEAEAREPEEPPKLKLPPTARDPLGLAIAQVVDTLRQREAAARDLPVGRVLSGTALGEIATRKPRTQQELLRTPHVKPPFVRAAGAELLAEIERLTLAAQKGELPGVEREKPRYDARRRDRETQLKQFRAGAAAARKVTPSVVLPTYVIESLLSEPPRDLDTLARVPWLGEKRLALYGEGILRALAE